MEDKIRKAIREQIKKLHEGLGTSALQVTMENGVVAIIEDPKDIEAYDRGLTVWGTDADGKEHELNIDWSLDSHMTANEGISPELSPQSNKWLEDQVNMYFGGANEPGGEAEFEITRIEQGDPQKYDDAHLAQKFLEELRGLGSIVVRYDDYIGDIKVTSDREGDAIVTWTWPEGMPVGEGMSPEEWADAKEAERLKKHPEKDKINKIKQMMDNEKYSSEYREGQKVNFTPEKMMDFGFEDNIEHYNDLTGVITKTFHSDIMNVGTSTDGLEIKLNKSITPPGGGSIDAITLVKSEDDFAMIDAEEAEYDKGWYGESLKEIASKLGYLKEKESMDNHPGSQNIDPEYRQDGEFDETKFEEFIKASFVYTEQGGHFYSLTLYSSEGQKLKMKYDEANEWVKEQLEYIHEGDLIPRRYNSGLEDLDLIVDRLKELGIEASHGDYMDVS